MLWAIRSCYLDIHVGCSHRAHLTKFRQTVVSQGPVFQIPQTGAFIQTLPSPPLPEMAPMGATEMAPMGIEPQEIHAMVLQPTLRAGRSWAGGPVTPVLDGARAAGGWSPLLASRSRWLGVRVVGQTFALIACTTMQLLTRGVRVHSVGSTSE